MIRTIDTIRVKKIKVKSELDTKGNTFEKEVVTLEARIPKLVKPTTRLLYGLIDLSFILVINVILVFILNFFADQLFLEFLDGENFIIGFVCILLVFAYYAFSEAVFGTTLGKHFFGYTVIDRFAERATTDDVLTRSIVRLIPIDPFSCFGKRGWHDQWSKTYVVKRSEKIELQRLLGTLSSKQEDLLD